MQAPKFVLAGLREPARAGQPEPDVKHVQAGLMEPAHAGEPIAAQHQQTYLRVPNQTESADYTEPPCQRVLTPKECALVRWGGGVSKESVFPNGLAPNIAISGEPALKFKDICLPYSSTKSTTNKRC
eukprot:6193272-Amphidinium_carterae.1